MNSLLLYLLKTVLCGALLYGYYYVALRNRLFHQWNRFYLLLIIPLSLLLPLARIEVTQPAAPAPELPLRLLQVVSDGNAYVDEVVPRAQGFNGITLLYCIYTVVALLLFARFAIGVLRLLRLARRFPARRVEGVDFILAPVPGTPFSFFRRVFWNPDIDPASESGRQILQHELVHVREQHSLDKIIVQATLALCWFNPVFWLLRAELHLVHEFIADRKSVRNQDAGTLAALILQAAYPEQYSGLSNPFFHRAIKRRLHMLNQLQKARVQYFGRVAALPLLALVGFTFAVRAQNSPAPVGAPAGNEKFTVVIDAGHGRMNTGEWNGAQSHGATEDELVLAVAQRVKALNSDPNLEIVFTRPGDAITGLKERPEIARRAGASLFLSLHVDALQKDNVVPADVPKGFAIYVPADSGALTGSRLFGSALQQALRNVYSTDDKLHTRKTGVWVLKASPCPAALLELGYINKDDDRAFITNSKNQDRIAHGLLQAITAYRTGKMKDAAAAAPAAQTDAPASTNLQLNDDGTVTVLANGKRTNMTAAEAKKRGYLDNMELNAPAKVNAVAATPADTVASIDVLSGRDVLVNYRGGRSERMNMSEAYRRGLINNADGMITKAGPNAQHPPQPLPVLPKSVVLVNGKRFESFIQLYEVLKKRYPPAAAPVKNSGFSFRNARTMGREEVQKRFGQEYEQGIEITATEAELAEFTALLWTLDLGDAAPPQQQKLRSGDTLTLEALRAIPLETLLSPEGYTLQNCTLAANLSNGDIIEAPMVYDGGLNPKMRLIIQRAWSGMVITVDNRTLRMADGTLKKLRSVAYFIR